MFNEDVKELLGHSKSEISAIAEQVKDGSVNKVAIKNVLENLRSILDYHGQDLLAAMKKATAIKKLSTKVYFPYGQRENNFKISIKKNLPGLPDLLPDAYRLIESMQPFKCSDNWLVDLCSMTNEAKHNNLSKTKNSKTVSIEQSNFIRVSNSTNVVLSGNYGNGKRLDDVYARQGYPVKVVKNTGVTQITEHNMIKFDGKEIEVGPFLEKCHMNIERFSNELTDILNQNGK
ncbi:hypothetical protein H5202_23090 [Shewanella sp. SG41-4]|uniref:hypothetical protein n=1 Tax=Shewanella sp. SG41-4 TaxID=2760976 RepID=UPI00160168E5|nr:hypothetical protein [Shewanella sp. SG41-4]MBB1441450.1 hypothetical protein [Shewanella sp. SG41-4]